MKTLPKILLGAWLLSVCSVAWSQDKPNILIIWGDDIGRLNLSV